MHKTSNIRLIGRKIIAFGVLVAFLLNSGIAQVPCAYGQELSQLSPPGMRINLSSTFAPPVLKGIKVYPSNPFRLDFILDKGDSKESNDSLKNESARLIRYFLASLTIPERDLWVNLSPYEKEHIITNEFGQTEMGRDLLAQDYMLKQITASVIYPEGEIGKKFWAKVYRTAFDKYGTTDILVDTFNKVWIMPDKAVVCENIDKAFIIKSHLKVMLESDYVALDKAVIKKMGVESVGGSQQTQELAKNVLREIVLPELEREVNEGKNFAQLRQVYQSLILAAWFKKKIKNSILGKVYVDQKKVAGVNNNDPEMAGKIWSQYVHAFKKGVYNYIKEEVDPLTQETLPRKYFSGGFDASMLSDSAMEMKEEVPSEGVSTDGLMEVAANLEMEAAREKGWISDEKVEDIFNPVHEKSFGWYEPLKNWLGDRSKEVEEFSFKHSLPPLVVHLFKENNPLEDVQRLLFQTLTARRIIVEVGAGGTRNTVALGAANKDAFVIGADLYDDNDKEGPVDYQEYAHKFNQHELEAQTSGHENIGVVRGRLDTMAFLPDKSVSDIVFVMPAIGILKDLAVLFREFGIASKLKPGGRLIVVTSEKNKVALDLLNDYFKFEQKSSDTEAARVRLFENSSYSKEAVFSDTKVFIGTLHDEAMANDPAMYQDLNFMKAEVSREIAGVKDEEQLKRMYRKLAMQWHPDKHQSGKEIAEEMFKFIKGAVEKRLDALNNTSTTPLSRESGGFDEWMRSAMGPGLFDFDIHIVGSITMVELWQKGIKDVGLVWRALEEKRYVLPDAGGDKIAMSFTGVDQDFKDRFPEQWQEIELILKESLGTTNLADLFKNAVSGSVRMFSFSLPLQVSATKQLAGRAEKGDGAAFQEMLKVIIEQGLLSKDARTYLLKIIELMNSSTSNVARMAFDTTVRMFDGMKGTIATQEEEVEYIRMASVLAPKGHQPAIDYLKEIVSTQTKHTYENQVVAVNAIVKTCRDSKSQELAEWLLKEIMSHRNVQGTLPVSSSSYTELIEGIIKQTSLPAEVRLYALGLLPNALKEYVAIAKELSEKYLNESKALPASSLLNKPGTSSSGLVIQGQEQYSIWENEMTKVSSMAVWALASQELINKGIALKDEDVIYVVDRFMTHSALVVQYAGDMNLSFVIGRNYLAGKTGAEFFGGLAHEFGHWAELFLRKDGKSFERPHEQWTLLGMDQRQRRGGMIYDFGTEKTSFGAHMATSKTQELRKVSEATAFLSTYAFYSLLDWQDEIKKSREADKGKYQAGWTGNGTSPIEKGSHRNEYHAVSEVLESLFLSADQTPALPQLAERLLAAALRYQATFSPNHLLFAELASSLKEEADKAMDVSKKGGIDFQHSRIDWQIQNTGKNVEFDIDPAMLVRFQKASGLSPVIINMRPMSTTLPVFFGLNDSADKGIVIR